MNRLEKFQNALSAIGADGALISSEVNQLYLSDFHFSDGYVLVTENEAFLITDSRYIEAARGAVKHMTVVLADGMYDTVKKLVSDNGISTLAIEDDSMSLSEHKRFSELLPCKLVAGASAALEDLRAVKDADEIDRMNEAQKITDAAFTHILDYITPDRTEKDVALELEFYMRKIGADGIAFDTIAVSGTASSLPHGVPRDVKLEKGFLTMDFGAKYRGYCSDMTRTVSIGRATDEMKLIYNTVLSAQLKALESMTGGMACRDADSLARDVIREAGFGSNFGHGLGHGVGMLIHEFPRLSPKASPTTVLTPGYVVTVEPGIYLEGKFGCRIEDMVYIDEDGSVKNFTKSPKELIELV